MIGPFWYDESDPGQLLVETARRLEMNQSDRRDLYLRHACLYGDIPLLGLSPSTYARVDPTEMRVSLNVIKSVCDAFQAELSASRVKATFLTEKGKYDLRQRAQGLDRFVEGAFYESELFDIGDELLLHAPVWGNGYARIDDDPDGFRVEKHFPWEILVDDADAVRGTPRCLIYRGYEPRAVVARRHPNMKREIMGAPSVASQDSWTSWANSTTADIILVTEGWCLPTAKGAKDGVYAVALDNGKCIHKSGYEESFFPIVPMRRAKPPMGFHAMGCAENLTGLQIEVNSILLDLQDARALYARPRWFVDIRSSVQTAHLNDDIDNIVKYNSAGNKPEVYVPQVMPPEVYRQLWDLYAKAYEIEGISQLAAQAVKPAGIESGAALRSLGDTQAKRHMVAHHQVERFYLNASKCFIAAARRLAAKKPDLVVKSAQKTFFEVAKYADYALEEDQYALRVYPTSALQGTPAAKIDQVYDWIKVGALTDPKTGAPDTAKIKRLLDFPDFGAELDDAPHDVVLKLISQMTESGEYQAPDRNMDLDDAHMTAQKQYLSGLCDGMPLEKLMNLDRFIDDCVRLKAEMAPPPAPPAPPAMPPMGAPL